MLVSTENVGRAQQSLSVIDAGQPDFGDDIRAKSVTTTDRQKPPTKPKRKHRNNLMRRIAHHYLVAVMSNL
ncbi:MAG TPA: hypothetical protein VFF11_07580, partial [Candidatus Binatia bacterium]|nr:hypothetical protein [Candidatus Binatia bacterium]